jgi:hypothetical protein
MHPPDVVIPAGRSPKADHQKLTRTRFIASPQ